MSGIRFPRLIAAIRALGNTDSERARALGKSRRTITSYKSGRLPEGLEELAAHPDLVKAYYADVIGDHVNTPDQPTA